MYYYIYVIQIMFVTNIKCHRKTQHTTIYRLIPILYLFILFYIYTQDIRQLNTGYFLVVSYM